MTQYIPTQPSYQVSCGACRWTRYPARISRGDRHCITCGAPTFISIVDLAQMTLFEPAQHAYSLDGGLTTRAVEGT